MIEKDFLKRQIDLFFQELAKFLTKKTIKEEEIRELANLSKKYTNKDIEYFIETSADDIIYQYKSDYDTLEIISELLFQIGDNASSIEIIYKSKKIIEFLNSNSDTFSFQRNERLHKINKICKKML